MTTFIFLLKLVLAPALISSASLAGRRWGPAISGWVIGLPLTTGPVIFFLALQQGTSYAATAALGTLSGAISLSLFTLVYSWLAQYCRWPLTVSLSGGLFLLTTFALRQLTFAAVPLFISALAVVLISLRLMPSVPASSQQAETPLPHWDLPARVLIATTIVIALTGVSPWLDPRLTGLLATFPIYTTIVAAFAQHLQGFAAAVRVQQGVLVGMFAFAFFYLILTVTLAPSGVLLAFACAIVVAAPIQAGSLLILRRLG